MIRQRKKTAEDKLKEVSRLALAEEYNCKTRELDEIISDEHQLLQKLRSGGLSDTELLELVGGKNSDIDYSSDIKNEYDDISFYNSSENAEN